MIDDIDALVQRMAAHVRQRIGPTAHLFHAPGPKLLHIDIFHVPPTPWRRCHTLLTCGMSLRPMCPPAAASHCRYAELYLSLPPSWKVALGHGTEATVWPLRELAGLARLPHFTESWLWTGHTVGFPDPEELITPSAGFAGWIVATHLSLGHDSCIFRFRGRTVVIHCAVPIYKEELALALSQGSEALFELLHGAGVSDVIDPARHNVCAQKP